MSQAASTRSRPPTLDASAAARWQAQCTDPARPSPWLHEEVARRMLERLDLIKRQPQTWAHWEPVLGGRQAQAALSARWHGAECLWVTDFEQNSALVNGFIGFDATESGVVESAPTTQSTWSQRVWQVKDRLSLFGQARQSSRLPRAPLKLASSAVVAAQVQMLWSNMMLHGVADPAALIQAWHRALAVEGCLMFSALGVDTAHELRRLYKDAGFGPASAQLTDMHDWGDMLVGAGFAEPVMDMEHLTLTYPDAKALLADWRTFGRNGHVARHAGLRTPKWRARLESALNEGLRQPSGELAITVEIIYGHAFKPVPRAKVSELSAISMQDMRAMLAQPKTRS